ncbi:MAG: stage II sporulation protein E [Bacillota bacterium]|nr:stage II sporulation protein E [Bacillota bacterium]
MADAPRIYPFRRDAKRSIPQPGYSARRRIKVVGLSDLATMLSLSFCAFLLARAQILGGLYPFGPAFLGAASLVYPKKGAVYLLPVLLGMFSAMKGPIFLVYAAMCCLLAVIFLLYSVDGKKQWFVLPGMIIASVMVSKGLLISLTTFTDYQLMLSIFESLISAGVSLIFLVILSAVRRFDVARRFSVDETVCIFIAAMGLLCGLNGWHIGRLDLQSMLSRLLIIVVSYLGGGGAGAAVGAMVGIIPSISQIIAPSIIATYAFSGLLAGVFGSFGRLGAAIGFILGNLILALYILTAAEISSSLLASAVAALLFLILPKQLYSRLKRSFASSGLKSLAEEKNERLLKLAVRKLRNSSWAFRDLAASLMVPEKESLPEEESNIKVCMEQLSHQLCSPCSLRDICWEIDYYQTFTGLIRLFEQVKLNGLVSMKDAPENFSKRCPHVKELLSIINCLYDLYCRSSYWQMQKCSSRNLLSSQLNGVAESLDKIAREIVDFGDEREILERELQRSIARRGLPIDGAGLISISDKSLDLWAQYVECPGENFCRQAISDEVSRLLGCDFIVHEHSCGGKSCSERCSYRMLAAGAHRLSLGQAQLAMDGRDVCGDSGGSIMLDEGRQLLMISDGMGVGDKAASDSAEAIAMVSHLLEAGFKQETAIDVVNAALSLRGNEERFVTLDLCVVDLYSGMADFIKSGSSASYIKRGSQVKMLRGSTLPVGMLYSADKDIISEQLLPGDMIIMASDGLLGMDVDDQGQWLSRVIEQAVVNTPQAMAEYLLDKVICIGNGKIKDDITVLVAQMGDVV